MPRGSAGLGLALGLAVVLGACTGPGDPAFPTPPPTSPPPALPTIGPEGPGAGQCFPRAARTRGVPGNIPVPVPDVLQGPDDYAGPYEPLGQAPRRIEGRGFAYEVDSRVPLVVGFHVACLEAYGQEFDWRSIRAKGGDHLFSIRLQGRPQRVIVLVADNPEGPSTVVIFTDYVLEPLAPSPTPAPSPSASPEESPAESPSGSPGG